MAPERTGLVLKLNARGIWPLPCLARSISHTASMSPRMSSALITTMWCSGRKLIVVGLSGPDSSASVPVSAMPDSAWLTPARSLPSEKPCLRSASYTHLTLPTIDSV